MSVSSKPPSVELPKLEDVPSSVVESDSKVTVVSIGGVPINMSKGFHISCNSI